MWLPDDDISIHALLAESDAPTMLDAAQLNISIHALLAESDVTIANNSLSRNDFYPRSPCGERLNCSRNGFAIL